MFDGRISQSFLSAARTACAIALLSIGLSSGGVGAQEWGTERSINQLTEHVYRWGADGQNGMFVLTPEGIILADGHYCNRGHLPWLKSELERRYDVPVKVVANSWMRTPMGQKVELVLVEKSRVLDVADDWIAERARPGDIVITADIPLAARCVEAGARVLGHRGRVFTPDSIGDALATRDLMADLREGGEMTGGPPPFSKRDRSKFLQALDETVHSVRRELG